MINIWVFGYGSLLWNPEPNAINFRKAVLEGWHREYNQLSRVSRGTRTNPGLALGLEEGGQCIGYIFQIPESEFPNWKRREGVNSKTYILKDNITNSNEIKIYLLDNPGRTTLFNKRCFVVVSNLSNPRSYVGHETLRERAQRAISSSRAGGGTRGTSIDYIKKNYESYSRAGIKDKALKEMYEEVIALEREESHPHTHLFSRKITGVEVYDSPAFQAGRRISNNDLIVGLCKEIRDALGVESGNFVKIRHGLREIEVQIIPTDKRLTSSGNCAADNPSNHCWMTSAVRSRLHIRELPTDKWVHRINYPAFKKKYSPVKISKS